MRILNVHQRRMAATAEAVGELVDSLSSPADRLWPGPPAGAWPPMRLAPALRRGARGGHGPVRYRVVEHVPTTRVRFEFEPGGWTGGLRGTHEFVVDRDGDGTVLRHVIAAEANGRAALRWLLVIRPLHDALIEDALDRAERELTGRLSGTPARWSAWVRALHAIARAVSRRA